MILAVSPQPSWLGLVVLGLLFLVIIIAVIVDESKLTDEERDLLKIIRDSYNKKS